MPAPEAPEKRFGILVVVCAELTVLAGIFLICHGILLFVSKIVRIYFIANSRNTSIFALRANDGLGRSQCERAGTGLVRVSVDKGRQKPPLFSSPYLTQRLLLLVAILALQDSQKTIVSLRTTFCRHLSAKPQPDTHYHQ